MEFKEGMRLLLNELAQSSNDNGDESEIVNEVAVLEVSPSKEWVKLRWLDTKDPPQWEKAGSIEAAVAEALPVRGKGTRDFLKEFFEAILTALELSEMLNEEQSKTAEKSD